MMLIDKNKIENYFKKSDSLKYRISKRTDKDFCGYLKCFSVLDNLTNKTVLDLGCGSGSSTKILREKFNHNNKIYGADLSFNILNASKKNDNTFVVADSNYSPFKPEIFDIVASCSLLEHIPTPEKTLSEMDRVLKKGGWVIIHSPNLLSLFSTCVRLIVKILKKGPKSDYAKIAHFIFSIKMIIKFILYKRPFFPPRRIDSNLDRFEYSDYDAVYFSNPFDLYFYFRLKKYQIIQISDTTSSGIARFISKFLPFLSGGIYFIAQKTQ